MDPQDNISEVLPDIKSATKLTPLQLNGIKLDDKHTILTPRYLENLMQPLLPE